MKMFEDIAKLPSCGDDELRRLLGECERVRSKVSAFESAVLSEIDSRKETMPEGGEGAARKSQRSSKTKARRKARKARALDQLPGVLAALLAGEITDEHVQTFLATLRRHRKALLTHEAALVEHARRETPELFADRMRRFEDALAEDDGKARFNRQRNRRSLSMWRRRDDGMIILRGEFDPVVGARIRKAIGIRAQQAWHQDNNGPAGARRSPEQRRADALEMLVDDADGNPNAGVGPGRPAKTAAAQIVLVADLPTLIDALEAAGRSTAGLADGTQLPVDTIRRMACEAEILPAIFDSKGQPLWLGQGTRLASRAQRLAVFARDKTCIGCDTPAEWCQVHHIEWWRDGGKTDVDNLCLVCSEHHHLVHEGGWTITQLPNGTFGMRPPPGSVSPCGREPPSSAEWSIGSGDQLRFET